jgi:hypothetical protein
MPSGIASTWAIRLAMIASCSDSAKRSLISSVIGAPVHIERPKSRRARPAIQFVNCFHSGWSRPSFARSWFIRSCDWNWLPCVR